MAEPSPLDIPLSPTTDTAQPPSPLPLLPWATPLDHAISAYRTAALERERTSAELEHWRLAASIEATVTATLRSQADEFKRKLNNKIRKCRIGTRIVPTTTLCAENRH
eukprot:GABV01011697.1.p1 GENE.GABV01011697.1~~GABV01011697.1.p1  ORF type:complete len:108 (-),score=22.01 GABV01011697.1:11-334(-)